MQQCVSSPSFVANQRRQVYSCDCCARADHFAIRVLLPTFSQMCPCSLLEGAHVTLGGTHLIYPQYRHAISNTPFHGLIWLRTQLLCSCTLFSPAPFVVCHVCFWLISASFLPDMPTLLMLPSAPANLRHPLFQCISSASYCSTWSLSSSPRQSASSRRGATTFQLALNVCCAHPLSGSPRRWRPSSVRDCHIIRLRGVWYPEVPSMAALFYEGSPHVLKGNLRISCSWACSPIFC